MANQTDCLCAGILFVDYICDPIRRLPESGELLRTEGITIALGGCASNTAIDLAKLGVSVGVAGCVGADAAGQLVRSTLDGAGVDVSGIRVVDAEAAAMVRNHTGVDMTRTAGTVVVNVEGDDRRFISTPGANDAFSAADLPDHWVDSAKVFYVGGYLMMPGVEDDAFVDQLRRMRARGCRTILDVVLMSDDAAHFEKVLEKSLPHTDLFMPN
ncbi:MAG: carbohydrate kinase family protein, partial [Planctomycetia bacterium]|nr:carbohydrate kinase family protein [Planctomycetia bacterium]